MSKDLTISAISFHDQVNANQIGYKNESIGDSILPHLVKRARLNPTVVNDTVEKRIHYSLHNDASQSVYISPCIKIENNSGHITTVVPGKPSEELQPDVLNPPDDPYTPIDPDNPNLPPGPNLPPNPPINPPVVPPITDDDEEGEGGGTGGGTGGEGGGGEGGGGGDDDGDGDGDDDDEEGGNTGGGGGNGGWKPVIPGGTGTGGGTGGGGGGGGGGFIFITGGGGGGGGLDYKDPIIPTENFDDYAKHIADGTGDFNKYPGNVDYVWQVKRFYESYHRALTTRRAFKDSGVISAWHSLDKVKFAQNMFENSTIQRYQGSLKILRDATEMFKGCESLDTAKLEAPVLRGINNMFTGCSVLREVSLGSNELCKVADASDPSNANYPNGAISLFEDCILLEKVELNPSTLPKIDKMFKGCESLNNGGLKLKSKTFSKCTDAVSAFEGSGLKTFRTYKFPILKNASRMLAVCNDLTEVNLDFPTATNLDEILIAGNMTARYERSGEEYKSDGKIKKVNIKAPCATSATNFITGQYKLSEVNIQLGGSSQGTLDVSNAIQNCTKLKELNFSAASASTANNFLKGTDNLTKINLTLGVTAHNDILNDKDKLVEANTSLPWVTNLTNLYKGCSELVTSNLVAQSATTIGSGGSADGIYRPDTMYPKTSCTKLEKINDHLPALVNASDLYSGMSAVKEVTGDWSAATNTSYMFYNCPCLETVSGKITSSKNCEGMFQNCPSIKSVSLTGGGGNCDYMFYNSSIDSADDAIVSKATSAEGMYAATKVKTACLNMPNCVNAANMYRGCKIKNIGTINFSSLKDARYFLVDALLSKADALKVLREFAPGGSATRGQTLLDDGNSTGPTIGYNFFEGIITKEEIKKAILEEWKCYEDEEQMAENVKFEGADTGTTIIRFPNWWVRLVAHVY